MLPSAHPAERAISFVVADPTPRSRMSFSAAWRIELLVSWARSADMDDLAVVRRSVVRADVTPHEHRRHDRRQHHEGDGHEDPDMHGVHERLLGAVVDALDDGDRCT